MPDYQLGQMVALNEDPSRTAEVICCEGPDDPQERFQSVGVQWSDTGEMDHIERSAVHRIPTLVENEDANMGVWERVVAATRQMNETLGRFNQAVGSANSGEQGGNMPEEAVYDNILVEMTLNAREQVFSNMNLPRLLMSNLDQENWNRHLSDIQNAVNNGTVWQVRRGAFGLDSYPVVTVGDSSLRMQYVYRPVAENFIGVASNGRLRLFEDERVPGETYFRLRPISDVEDRAWQTWIGASSYIYADREEESGREMFSLRSLATLMSEYSQFMSSADRRAFIRRAMRERLQENTAGTRTPKEQVAWSKERMEKFKVFLDGVKSRLQVEPEPFLNLPILPHKTLSSRTWGIEIEAVHIDDVKTPKYWELKGDGSLRDLSQASMPSKTMGEVTVDGTPAPPNPDPQPQPSREDHDSDCDIWDDEEECTCGFEEEYADYARDYRAWYDRNRSSIQRTPQTRVGEWNSPVLRSFHSRGLKYLCGELEPRRTNDSAGIHVHVGAADLTPEQAIQLTIIYTALEPLFESEYKRGETRRFCVTPDDAELINRFNKMREAKRLGQKATAMQFGSRYWTVNLASLASHKTVEFRSMGSVYNYETLVRWAYFCREMVNIARANVPQSEWTKVRTMKDLVVLFSKYGKETPTPEWAPVEKSTDVIEKLGTENRRVPHTSALDPTRGEDSLQVVNDDYSSAEVALYDSSYGSRW